MLSFDQIQSKISEGVYQMMRPPQPPTPYEEFYIAAVYPDYAIVHMYAHEEQTPTEAFYKLPYTIENDNITLPPREQWQTVEREWVAKSLAMTNTLKTISKDDNWLWVGNHIIMYGARDLTNMLSYDPVKKSFAVNPKGKGEYFTKSTLLDSPYTATGILHMDVEHGLAKLLDGPDAPGEDDVVGFVDWRTAKQTEKGTWVQQALNRRNQYIQALEPLIDAGLIGTSSEAIPEMVEITKNGEIKKWGLKRNTLSFMPADPRMIGENAVTALKSLAERFPGLKAILPQDGGDPSATGNNDPAPVPPTKSTNFANPKETNIMGENTQDPNARMDAIEQRLSQAMEKFSKGIETITTALEGMPKLNGTGYKTDDGGKADPSHKSLGDFLLAVKRNDEVRLKSVYGSRKDVSGETGEAGGWMVPEEQGEMMQIQSVDIDPVMSRVDVIPVSRPSGTYPALDQYTAVTAGSGDTPMAGQVKATTKAAGGTLDETDPKFKQLQWRLHKVGGTVDVENEIGEDAPMLEALLRSLFAIAIASKNHRNVLRGSGVGEPLGILNAACAIGVTPATNNLFSYADSLSMLSKFKRIIGQPIWLHHPGIIADVGVMEIGTAGAGAVFLANGPKELHTYPLVPSDHLPQANNSGAVILADLKAYKFWMNRAGLAIAFSEHAKFEQDMGVWRFTQRNDGKPWLKSYITLPDPQGSYTVSPFVYHND